MTLRSLVIAHINLGGILISLTSRSDLVLRAAWPCEPAHTFELTVIKNLGIAGWRSAFGAPLRDRHRAHEPSQNTLTPKTKLTTISVNQTASQASSDFIDARTIVLGYLVHLPLGQLLVQ